MSTPGRRASQEGNPSSKVQALIRDLATNDLQGAKYCSPVQKSTLFVVPAPERAWLASLRCPCHRSPARIRAMWDRSVPLSTSPPSDPCGPLSRHTAPRMTDIAHRSEVATT